MPKAVKAEKIICLTISSISAKASIEEKINTIDYSLISISLEILGMSGAIFDNMPCFLAGIVVFLSTIGSYMPIVPAVEANPPHILVLTFL